MLCSSSQKMTMRFSFRLLHAEKNDDGWNIEWMENVRKSWMWGKASKTAREEWVWKSVMKHDRWVRLDCTAELVVGQKAQKKISQSRSYSRRNSLLPPVCRHLASLRLKLKSCSISLKFNQQKSGELRCGGTVHWIHDVLAFGYTLHVLMHQRMTMCLVCV